MHNILNILTVIRNTNYLVLLREVLFFVRFFVLVVLYLFFTAFEVVFRSKFLKRVSQPLTKPATTFRNRVLHVFNYQAPGEISSLDLITLAVRHLTVKKTRTMITIGGMALGFGTVIFLLSLGYGVQRLVVSRVARLGEMKQINVTVGQASALRLNESVSSDFAAIDGVSSVIPMISVVSKVTYNNSVSDAVAYGVTKQFLEESAIQPSRGTLFEDGTITAMAPVSEESQGQVAGAQTELYFGAKMNKEVSQVTYSQFPLVWRAVYAEPSEAAAVIGYTTRVVGKQNAVEVWGDSYVPAENTLRGSDSFGNEYKTWIRDEFPLWKKEACSVETYGCTDGSYLVDKENGTQVVSRGFIREQAVSIERFSILADSRPSISEGEVVEQIQFSLSQGTWTQVYSDASNDSPSQSLYTSQEKSNTLYNGELLFGESYYSRDGWGDVGTTDRETQVGYWIRAELPLWRKIECDGCETYYLKETDEQEKQLTATAYIRAAAATIEDMATPVTWTLPSSGAVLGDATISADLADNTIELGTDQEVASGAAASQLAVATPTEITLPDGGILQAQPNADGTIEWVTIASGSAETALGERTVIPYPENGQKVAVVNKALLNVFGLSESDALEKTFTTTFMLDAEFFADGNYQAETEPTEYRIIGIIPEEKTPSFYLPFSDIKSMGIDNYSQVKVIVDDQQTLPKVRESIESSGFKTNSVVDTVEKINSLFDTIRLLLSLLGFIALSVAALGMFNTLTISLLEKTREVGLMKAIGMKSNEVQRLFLAESIVMGLSGGIFGLILSFVFGNTISFLLSVISLTKGLGYINLVYIPLSLAVTIVSLAFVIGISTGLYPSHRATKISALNALRYE